MLASRLKKQLLCIVLRQDNIFISMTPTCPDILALDCLLVFQSS